jgi:hypothetical protein
MNAASQPESTDLENLGPDDTGHIHDLIGL